MQVKLKQKLRWFIVHMTLGLFGIWFSDLF